MEDFDEACRKLRLFAMENGRGGPLAWVFREDLSQFGRRILVSLSDLGENTERARTLYERGVDAGHGVRLDVLCAAGGLTFCSVWVPADRDDALNAMLPLGVLKLSCDLSLLAAQVTPSRTAFSLVRWVDRIRHGARPDSLTSVPSRRMSLTLPSGTAV